MHTGNVLNTPAHLEQWLNHITTYRVPVYRLLTKFVTLRGVGLEIGAGTCWFSALLSQSDAVKHITAVEIDPERLKRASTFFIPRLRGNPDKLTLHVGDFHGAIPVEKQSLDFIVCDAALHHTDNLPKLLAHLTPLLKPGGVLAAIREPILPTFVPLALWRKKMFGRAQKSHGDIEMIYTKNEWRRFFSEAGLTLTFHEYYLHRPLKEKIVGALRAFNGVLFNRAFFVAQFKRQ